MGEFPVFTLQIPNPFFEGRNRVYVIPSDPVTMIDTGIATQRAFETLLQELKQHDLELEDVGRVILTHKHIDHIGSAWRIQQQTGAEILIHESEMHAVSDVDPEGQRFADLVKQRMRQWDVPDHVLPSPASSSGLKWEIQSAVATGIKGGQCIDLGCGQLEVIHTPGHTRGSVCLRFGPYLLSGDHVLPDISPNIGAGDMRRRGLLRDYLDSLTRIVSLAADVDHVLPGHGDRFVDLSGRCRELREHHRDRLRRVLEILQCQTDLSVYEIACQLFGDMDDFHVILGCAEAQAHLEYLVDEGRVVCEHGSFRIPGAA